MGSFFKQITYSYVSGRVFNITMLLFRLAISLELIVVHGLKKLGVGGADPEVVPNPLHLPEFFNQGFAITANLVFPLFAIIGLFTRLAVVPIICVTLIGYLMVHAHDSLLVRDVPFMYCVSSLLILVLGPGKYSIDHFIHHQLLHE